MPARSSNDERKLGDFLRGKSERSLSLYHHFIATYRQIGDITIHPAKTMIGIATDRKRITYVTQLGKNFIHVVFPFGHAYPDNLCFQKIARVPGDIEQHNHHLRILNEDDINEEVKKFMKLAYQLGC